MPRDRWLARFKQALIQQGHSVDDQDLARILPFWLKDILVHGTYDFSDTYVVL